MRGRVREIENDSAGAEGGQQIVTVRKGGHLPIGAEGRKPVAPQVMRTYQVDPLQRCQRAHVKIRHKAGADDADPDHADVLHSGLVRTVAAMGKCSFLKTTLKPVDCPEMD